MPMELRNNIRVWGLSNIDENTLAQADQTSRCPVVVGLALMPDAHLGIGATVGSVILTEGCIIPAAVGGDIGCGLIAVQTSLSLADMKEDMQPLVLQFGRSIPAGVGQERNLHSTGATDMAQTAKTRAWLSSHPHDLTERLQHTALAQLGTLGSGNHFLEVCKDENERIWVVLHSGSRGVGNQLTTTHISLAREQKQELENRDLSYFEMGTPAFDNYLYDMLWAQDYAYANRELMMSAALDCLFSFIGAGQELSRINCHHNFAAQEVHEGRRVWVTRKGAIRAGIGDAGIIPGSMATGTYITVGKGNPLSYNSSSHGAGRKLSRGGAKRTFTVESLNALMEGKAWNRENAKLLLDEHPGAYKDIESVMDAQADLTGKVHHLVQIVNYKGS